ncbi:MAG: aspartate--tRNA ligase [Acidobacteria bacterium]|nr:aspartate--tRNA ligase [Acidobacteriota bacterium]MBU4308022.1 aspartate--tRNA ligase [Acidobacteriota bacterium]MCG2812327.1 aspartate--tRNA ligase [Candidatus Aminicenantes bacterium]
MAEKKLLKRETYCGAVREEDAGRTVTVYGWVNNMRELGGLTFFDLRDREGLLQVVVNETFSRPEILKGIGKETVLAVSGLVVKRAKANPDLPSGRIELIATDIEILATSEVPPFVPENRANVSEELRFKHRYIDLRNLTMQQNFKLRSKVNLLARNFLDKEGFLDIETPMLTNATPEGARDYLVPSRIYKGKMFALPQSPQQFKQLLMVAGFERYFQITRCFRDEDLRADRQPEFTQIDIEMSFAERDELFAIVERLMREIFALRGRDVALPFRRLPYREAMEKYGSDKPDLRIPYQIQDFTAQAGSWNSDLLNAALAQGAKVKGLVIPDAGNFSRKQLDEINEMGKKLGGKGVIWMKKGDDGFKASLKIASATMAAFYEKGRIDPGSLVLLVADLETQALVLAGKLREHLGEKFRDKDRLEFLWVTDFPLFFYNEEEKRLDSNHHPFTAPSPEDISLLDSQPLAVKAIAYDLVLNGVEIGGGSKRIHDIALQKKVFQMLNLEDKEIEEKFGFFLNALKFGAPPHLGIALGFDRLLMLLTGEDSIREIIAFPKTTSSLCLLTGSPSAVSQRQLDELGIAIKK